MRKVLISFQQMLGGQVMNVYANWAKKVHVACNLIFVVKNEGVFKVTGRHVHFKSSSILKTVLDKDVETTVHKQELICCTAI